MGKMKKCVCYEGVWVIWGMGYKGVDCIHVSNEPVHANTELILIMSSVIPTLEF